MKSVKKKIDHLDAVFGLIRKRVGTDLVHDLYEQFYQRETASSLRFIVEQVENDIS